MFTPLSWKYLSRLLKRWSKALYIGTAPAGGVSKAGRPTVVAIMKRVNIGRLSVVGVGVVGNSVMGVDVGSVGVEGVDTEGVNVEGVEVFGLSVPIVPLSSSREEQRSGSVAAVVLRKLDSQRGNVNMSMVGNFYRYMCRSLYSSKEPEGAQPNFRC